MTVNPIHMSKGDDAFERSIRCANEAQAHNDMQNCIVSLQLRNEDLEGRIRRLIATNERLVRTMQIVRGQLDEISNQLKGE